MMRGPPFGNKEFVKWLDDRNEELAESVFTPDWDRLNLYVETLKLGNYLAFMMPSISSWIANTENVKDAPDEEIRRMVVTLRATFDSLHDEFRNRIQATIDEDEKDEESGMSVA